MKKQSLTRQKTKPTSKLIYSRDRESIPSDTPASEQAPLNGAAKRKKSPSAAPSQENNPLSRLFNWWGMRDVAKAFDQLEDRHKSVSVLWMAVQGMFREIYERLIQHGYQSEGDKLATMIQQYAQTYGEKSGELGIRIEQDRDFYEIWRTLASLSAFSAYLERGEEAALERLPILFNIDCAYFVQQPWISELIASWCAQGKQKEINLLLCGKPSRGRRSFQTIMEKEEKDKKIYAEVERLLKAGWRYKEATKHVTDNQSTLGINSPVGLHAVRRIYQQRKAGYTPLRSLFL